MKGDEKSDHGSAALAPADVPRRFLTLSNILSLTRLLLSVPFVLVMRDGSPEGRLWGALLMVAAALTDKLDGYFARRYHQISEWGRILDPLADKIAVAAVILVLSFLGDLPLWFPGVAVGRDLVILAGGLYLKRRTGVLVQSNEFGKWTVGVVALTLFVFVLFGRTVTGEYLLWISTLLLLISLWLYGRRFYTLMNAGKG